MSTVLPTSLAKGDRVLIGDREVTIDRVHAGAPKKHVLVTVRSGTGVAMVALPDTDRVEVVEHGHPL